MSKKRKGGRRTSGGRTTAKQRSAEVVDRGAEAAPDLQPVVDTVLGYLDGFETLGPFERDLEAAAFVDWVDTGGRPTLAELVEVFEQVPRSPEVADALHIISLYGGRQAKPARKQLKKHPMPPSPAAMTLGTATIDRAWLVTEELGDVQQVTLGLRYPNSDDGYALGVLIDVTLAGMATTMFAIVDRPEFLAGAEENDELELHDIPIPEACARILQALKIGDNAIGADGYIEPEVAAWRPIIDMLAEDHRKAKVPIDEPVSDAARREQHQLFLAWIATNHPELEPLAKKWGRLPFDFALHHAGGDPLRLSPSVVANSLHWASVNVAAPIEELREIPTLMLPAATWAHEHNGWGTKHFAAVEEALSEAGPVYLAAIETPPGEENEENGEVET